MKTKNKIILAVIGYVLMASITFGYAYNQRLKFENEHYPHFVGMNTTQAEGDGLFCALVWPLYWPFHLSVQMWANSVLYDNPAKP
jgi:hypothetical protein